MNKKGAEKILSVWWIFVLGIIAGFIIIGVLIYYRADINIKEFEADILAERIVRCLVDNGYLNQDFLEKEFDIFEECNLKKEVFGKGNNFYFNVSVHDKDGNLLRKSAEDIIEGAVSFEKDCQISESPIKARHYPRCSEKNEMVLYYDNGEVKEAKLKVLAGSDQEIKKVNII